jgi:hypothetical protein
MPSGEALQYYVYGTRPWGCLFILLIFGTIILATLVTLFLFGIGYAPIARFVTFWILFAVFGTIFLRPFLLFKVLALTDRRLLVLNMKDKPFRRFRPVAIAVKEYPSRAWPTAKLSLQFVRRFILTLKGTDGTFKLQLYAGDPENIEAAKNLVAQLTGSDRDSVR